jgi:glycerophosphoryl diester phosphodiesterase
LKAVGWILAKIGLRRLAYLLGFWPDAATVRLYRDKGCAFHVFTVNDELRAKLYMRAGFEAIGTDDPGFLVELSKRLRT